MCDGYKVFITNLVLCVSQECIFQVQEWTKMSFGKYQKIGWGKQRAGRHLDRIAI